MSERSNPPTATASGLAKVKIMRKGSSVQAKRSLFTIIAGRMPPSATNKAVRSLECVPANLVPPR
jgi:hypothetical protein